MKLYHGSIEKVTTLLLHKCRSNTDFGKGFYTTTDFDQAYRWAVIQKKRSSTENAVVSEYAIDEKVFTNCDFSIYVFSGATEEWLRFILANRNGIKTKSYDIINGPVANDNLYATLLLFEQGTLSVANAIEKLKTYTLVNQVSFHTPKALQQLTFIESYLR
ncbi:MAG: DUF3990 domain-containing protein [Thermoguttaceae bacterium]